MEAAIRPKSLIPSNRAWTTALAKPFYKDLMRRRRIT